MDPSYEAYTIADSTWYEPLERCQDSDSLFSLSVRELPQGWRREHQGVWEFLMPGDTGKLPEQGWKIHVSATPGAAEETIEAAWTVCRQLELPWKFLRSRRIVAAMNTKYAHRAASGKAVTVYPRTTDELRRALDELETVMRGRPGPYVLSDRRWNDGPVSVRYGAFILMWCERADGTRVPALRTPQGQLVPDHRRPVFTLPPWADVPDFLAERPAADGESASLGGYEVRKALHFSNGGGVYLAHDGEGRQVVLKEARPHAGLDANGMDAVDRLRTEDAVLDGLGHLPFVPRRYGAFTAWEHHYLAMEYVEGETVSAWLGREHPLTRHRPTEAARTRFAASVVERMEQVAECVRALHEAGVAFGDLHHRNILIRPDGTVALVDFELAAPVGSVRSAALGAPGFADPALTDPREADLFALGCCQLAALVPLTVLTLRNPRSVASLIELARASFPSLPAEFIRQMTERLALSPALRPHLPPPGTLAGPPPPLTPPSTDTLLRGIARSADTGRKDRRYPCDVAGHRPGAALGLAYGTPGVLWAQHAAGTAVSDDDVEWLAGAVRRAPLDTPAGLYDGMAGAAWLLHRLGHPQGANLVDRLLAGPLPASPGLFSGLSGIAHLFLDVGLKDEALALALRVRERVGTKGLLDRPGLMHGWSGPAVLFARCAEVTGDLQWAAAAERAVRCDLAHARDVDGMLQMHSSSRLLPYLAEGSAGVAMAALALPPPQAAALGADGIVAGAARAGAVEVVLQGGLFSGRSGLAYLLSHALSRTGRWQAELDSHLRALTLHLAPYEDAHVLHGDQLVRLSADLATGSAGALIALAAAKNPGSRLLPGAHPTCGWPPAGSDAPDHPALRAREGR
ncbi:class III lanthionine synthetase LanKC [Streptomyces hiroshimensis]|uniref:non-specific serine/threonine protein kinase n=1 Tax=Streptomyces hiroshimensis TaxID=66424 RepID=A0ABQ2ZED7_9ACTN|nr:class III lanthionine synthetase LanKC [Streptomyces hiroshimensis]GGY11127.1 serine/threonine protein kinase [Streptomyces hiroshimensis]